MHTDQLATMTEAALRTWPEIAYKSKRGNRAQSAAALVRAESVRYIDGTWWEVSNHLCTATTCDCEDRAPIDIKSGGKLCKHCIAVRMTVKLSGNAKLVERLRALGGGERVQLLIDRDYEQRTQTITGYRSMGRDIRWGASDRIDVTFEQMVAAIEALGWSLDGLPQKWQRWEYLWTLRTDDRGTRLTAALWHMKGVTGATLDRRRSEKLTGWFAGQMAAAA
jgi:hypothetical protein